MKLKHSQKKVMALVLVPLSFTVICYLVLFLMISPALEPMMSLYSLISSEHAGTDENSNENLYQNKLVSSPTIKASEIEMPSYGDLFGKITIPSVNETVNLYYGDGNEQLRKGAGLFNGSFLPGFNHTSLIAGHSIPYFECLGDVKVGDTIQISTHYGDFEYRVTDTKIAKATDESNYDLGQTEKEQLILYTCYPFEIIGYKENRLFVYCDKISGPTILEGE